jgi:holliday junction DNA helicase RuvA
MIGYLEGEILQIGGSPALLKVGPVGYEVVFTGNLCQKPAGAWVNVFIYYYQTDRQPKPLLVGFASMTEKKIFELLISVDGLGPMKAAQVMSVVTIQEIAHAIETEDIDALKDLKGVGQRTAQKLVAALRGKLLPFMSVESPKVPVCSEIVKNVLTHQLSYPPSMAADMIEKALRSNPDITDPGKLMNAIYDQQR